MSKWVKVSEGRWKLVSDEDERPEDKDFSSRPSKKGSPMVIAKVPWASIEKDVHASDPKKQTQATDAFYKERTEWTNTSSKYRRWEADRKKEWAKNKPLWRKQRMKEDPLLGMN